MSSDGRQTREVAYRVFAAEYDDATHSYKESDEERAPNYVVTPGGARVNRLFVVGVLTEIERVGDDDVLRARVVDPTGAFVVYAGQYQPEAVAALEDAEPPTFIAVTGKANTFTPDGSDRTFSSIRPESVAEVDAETRDRWVVTTARHTLDRVGVMASALERAERGENLEASLASDGVPPHLAAGIPRALEVYDTKSAYLAALRELAVDAARQIAGELDEVGSFDVDPADTGEVSIELGTDLDELHSLPVTQPDDTQSDAQATASNGPAEMSEGTGGDDGGVQTENGTDTETGGEAATREAQEPVETDTEAGTPASEEPADEPGASVETEGASQQASGTGATDPDADMPLEGDEMYDMDDEEREAVESEFGVEFSSGSEIPDAGEADIETPAGDEESADSDEPTDQSDIDDAPGESGDETTSSTEPEVDGQPDLEDTVVQTMRDLGDGTAVDRSTLVETVVEGTGVDEPAIEEAIQDALMSGRCYESGDDELTPI